MINDRVIVKYQDKIVGKLGYTSDRRVAFQYDEKWLENGFSLNPFELPLTSKILIAKKPYFQGLFGVFSDSLPDNWGRLLLDCYLESKGINCQDIGILDRLVMVGDSHNQDDHAKNFTFIYYPDQKVWRLSPAYDLTYSTTYYGEHTTSVNGKGINISEEDMLKVGLENKLDRKKCLNIINQVKECVLRRLGKYIKK